MPPFWFFIPQIQNINLLLEYQLEPCVYSWLYFINKGKLVAASFNELSCPFQVQYLVSTVLALSENERHALQQHLKSSSVQNYEGVYSHLGASEDEKPCGYAQRTFTQGQRIKSRSSLSMETIPSSIY